MFGTCNLCTAFGTGSYLFLKSFFVQPDITKVLCLHSFSMASLSRIDIAIRLLLFIILYSYRWSHKQAFLYTIYNRDQVMHLTTNLLFKRTKSIRSKSWTFVSTKKTNSVLAEYCHWGSRTVQAYYFIELISTFLGPWDRVTAGFPLFFRRCCLKYSTVQMFSFVGRAPFVQFRNEYFICRR